MKFYFKEPDTITKDSVIKGAVITSIDTSKIDGDPRLINLWLNADIYLNEYDTYRNLKYAVCENRPFCYSGEAVEAVKVGDKIKFSLSGQEAYILSSDFLSVFTEWMDYFNFEKRVAICAEELEDEENCIRYLQYMLGLPTEHNYTLEEIKHEMKNADVTEIGIYCLSAMREKLGELADRIFDALIEGEKYGIEIKNMEPPTKKKFSFWKRK
ncbi:MAG: hypothetical protein IJ217_04730 [Clostridia bacterium]|nr:hypothetical protein [Clostridia bacterium]